MGLWHQYQVWHDTLTYLVISKVLWSYLLEAGLPVLGWILAGCRCHNHYLQSESGLHPWWKVGRTGLARKEMTPCLVGMTPPDAIFYFLPGQSQISLQPPLWNPKFGDNSPPHMESELLRWLWHVGSSSNLSIPFIQEQIITRIPEVSGNQLRISPLRDWPQVLSLQMKPF